MVVVSSMLDSKTGLGLLVMILARAVAHGAPAQDAAGPPVIAAIPGPAMGAALGFSLVLVLFSAMRERLEGAPVPAAFRGAPITLITAGIFSLAFMGFAGLGG